MQEPSFILNNRFMIKPSLGVVRDGQTGQETRIEPRLMSLLCLLAENNERLVARTVITRQIWDDYGNADEGLTQAISYLRKVLADEEKLLIETVPKKGYVLHAKVVYEVPEDGLKDVHGAKRGKFILIVAVVFILIAAAVFFIFSARDRQQQRGPDVIPALNGSAGSGDTRPGNNADKRPDTPDKVKPGDKKP